MKTQKAKSKSFSLVGARIVLGGRAHETERLAAAELSRFLYLLTRRASPVVSKLPSSGPVIILDGGLAGRLGVMPGTKHPQGYRLLSDGRRKQVIISANTPAGTLYGVYGLLEALGMGFYAGGETYPRLPSPAEFPAGFDSAGEPAFRIRGNMLHYNFLCGCTDWGLDDYKFYFDQLARMRCNLLLMHWYDNEPGAAYEYDGAYLAGGRTPNSLNKPWGAMASLRTSQFYFGTGRYFPGEIWSSPAGEDLPSVLEEIKRTERMFSAATRYARRAGIYIAAGFEAPTGDPTDRKVVDRFQARMEQFLERNPHLSHFALWQNEGVGAYGSTPPVAGSAARKLMESRRSDLTFLGNDRRIWEAARYGRFAEIAAEYLVRKAPRLSMAAVGWGGDRWMCFADMCLAFDKWLPPNVAFTCHDNIDAAFGPNVSTPWGQLPAERERWAMPWVEGDIDECWVRQPHVEDLGKLAPDALAKGAQGLLTLQWRTRDVEEETGYIARYAWDTTLTPERFYHDLARHSFGPAREKKMGRMIGDLQRLGARWTGVRGSIECGYMFWTGHKPHYPFDLTPDTPAYFIPMAEKAIDNLSVVPADADDPASGAYHLLSSGEYDPAAPRDQTRLGVAEVKKFIELLRGLQGRPVERIRTELAGALEELWVLRKRLIETGWSSASYCSYDTLLFALHHTLRNAGAARKMPFLAGLRNQLAALRPALMKREPHRVERLDYLAATMDFVLHYDRAAMLCADNEEIDKAVARAAETKSSDPAKAAEIAARAYDQLVAAGMPEALTALTRKLTTACDYGMLATVNVKMMPFYWETMAKIEEFFPAVPPRELAVSARTGETWICWEPSSRTKGHHLYRRRIGSEQWIRANKEILPPNCGLFADRPGGRDLEYAVSALDGNGWESPYSHPARPSPALNGPRIAAVKPYGFLETGRPFSLRVVVLSDCGLKEARLHYRLSPSRWRRMEMTNTHRSVYAGSVPAAGENELLEFFVEAVDKTGNRSLWPATAPILPWTLAVVREEVK